MKAHNIILSILLCGITVPAFGQESAPSPSLNLLIEPFSNATANSQYDYLAEGMNELLLDCVGSPRQNLYVVDRNSYRARNDELTLKAAASYQGQVVAASHLLRGSLMQTTSGLRITTLVFDIATTQLVHAATLPLQGLTVNPGACRDWRSELLAARDTQVVLTLQPEQFPERQALLDAGTSALHNGEVATAISHFLRLTHEYPGDPLAQYWLARGLYLGGLPTLAELQVNETLQHHPTAAQFDELHKLLQQIQKSKMEKDN